MPLKGTNEPMFYVGIYHVKDAWVRGLFAHRE